jgi:membrane protein
VDQQEDPRGRRPSTWKDVAVRLKRDAKEDDVSLLAGGVAFFALLALVPALVAIVSIYGLFANENTVLRQVNDLLGAAPQQVRDLVTTQLQAIVRGSSAGAGVTAVVAIAVALWSASSGMSHLIGALNLAYDQDEHRGFVRVRGISLVMTVGAIVFLLMAFGIIAILPAALSKAGLGAAGRIVIGVIRWVVLLAGMMVGLAVLFRYGPARHEPKWSWASRGALFATVLWIIASLLFSLYAANFAHYNETYGTLGAIIVVMLWLYLTALAIILGAELNAELERRTLRESTGTEDGCPPSAMLAD